MRAGRPGLGLAALALVVALMAAAGCGDEAEPTFTAEEFVEAVNREGVDLKLGEPLVTAEQGKELYAVELEPLGGPRVDSQGEDVHAGGSLSAYEEEDDAIGEFDSCRRAAALLCYQAANVVIVLEGGGLEAQQLGVAIRRMAGRE